MRLLGSSGLSAALLVLVTSLALPSCSGPEPDLVVYTAVDQEHAERIIRKFQDDHPDLVIVPVFDVEANKTIGLVDDIRREAHAPRCDVFWNNEIANTIALADEGLLAPYDSPSAADIPERFRDPEHRWTGIAMRARCIILNEDRMRELGATPEHLPDRFMDLLEGDWAGHGALARPLSGTTLTHLAVLYEKLGFEQGHALAERLYAANVDGELDLVSGNGPLMRKVGDGQAAWGFTDTDDFNVGRIRGYPVSRVFADQGEDGIGTLVIPNAVSIVANCRHPELAKEFVDFLLSKEVEAMLAAGDSAQIPTRDDVPRPDHVPNLRDVKVMDVDWVAVGRNLPRVHEDLKKIFLR
ncbi:MAG: extracellular solute-binding protein [Planctomycetota bacterium]